MVNRVEAFIRMWLSQPLRNLRDMKNKRHGNVSFTVEYSGESGHTTLYSYGEPIARMFWRPAEGLIVTKVWVTDWKFSVTTSRHVNHVLHHTPANWVVRSSKCPESYDAMLVAQDAMLEQRPAHPKSLFEEKS